MTVNGHIAAENGRAVLPPAQTKHPSHGFPPDLYKTYQELSEDEVRDAVKALPQDVRPAVIHDVPVTVRHPPPSNLDSVLPNPGMPYATRAVSREKPKGSDTSVDNATVLQQHIQFWDFDGDGVIYPWNTFIGFYKIGFHPLLCLFFGFAINAAFAFATSKSWIPNPLFPIYLDRVNRTKHGSDSETYDTEGRFVPQKFEEIFSKYDHGNKGGLSWTDLMEMCYNNMNVNDPAGWFAERMEWTMTYILLRNDNGILSKERIRGMLDGSAWAPLAAEVAEKRKRDGWRLDKLFYLTYR